MTWPFHRPRPATWQAIAAARARALEGVRGELLAERDYTAALRQENLQLRDALRDYETDHAALLEQLWALRAYIPSELPSPLLMGDQNHGDPTTSGLGNVWATLQLEVMP